MPYIVVRALWPFSSKDELIKKVIENMKKFPADDSLYEEKVSANRGTLEGVRTLVVWEIKKGKLEEVITLVGKMLATYGDIEGFTSTSEIWGTAIESYANIGRTPPE